MLGFMGINLMFDEDAINPIPTILPDINEMTVSEGIINHAVLNKNITQSSTSSADYATWTLDTVMNAMFNGSMAAGSVDFLGQTISRILIKRKDANDITGKWTVVGQININGDVSALQFDFTDRTNRANTEYKYGLVPVFMQTQASGVSIEVEGTPIESDTVLSEFDGVFICDKDSFYKLYAGVNYGDTTINQLVGVHTTLGREYPILVANSKTHYKTGSVSAKVVTDDVIDGKADVADERLAMAELAEGLESFMTDKKPKILKDWNGNVWLVVFTDTPSISYDNNYGMGIPSINANWTQVGDANNSNDLARAGISNYGGA